MEQSSKLKLYLALNYKQFSEHVNSEKVVEIEDVGISFVYWTEVGQVH